MIKATAIGNRESAVELLPCPFCGSKPVVQPWHGGGPRKHAVGCYGSRCEAMPMVTGETKSWAIRRWNTRKGQVAS